MGSSTFGRIGRWQWVDYHDRSIWTPPSIDNPPILCPRHQSTSHLSLSNLSLLTFWRLGCWAVPDRWCLSEFSSWMRRFKWNLALILPLLCPCFLPRSICISWFWPHCRVSSCLSVDRSTSRCDVPYLVMSCIAIQRLLDCVSIASWSIHSETPSPKTYPPC